MKLLVNKDRTVYSAGTWGTKNENNYEILDMEFPEELQDYNKRIVYFLDDKIVWDTIIDNKAYITNAITKKEKVKAYVWLTQSETITLKYVCDGTEEGDYYFTYNNESYYFTMPTVAEDDELIFDVQNSILKLNDTTIETSSTGSGQELEFYTMIDADKDFRTKLFELQFFENENADGIVPTPEQVDGFNTMLTAMNAKIDEVDALEQTIETAEAERQEAEISREQRTDEAINNIVDMTAAYNENAQAKTNEFNQNASQKTNDFNSNYSQKVNDFNANATQKTNEFDSHVTQKVNDFDTHAAEVTDDFDDNAAEKTETLNQIAEGIEDMTTAIQFATFEVDNDMHLNIIQAERMINTNFLFNPDTGRLGVRIYNG